MAKSNELTSGGVGSCSLNLPRWKKLHAYMKKHGKTKAEVMREAFDMLMKKDSKTK